MQSALGQSFAVASIMEMGARRRDVHVARFFAPKWSVAQTDAAAIDIAAIQEHSLLLAKAGVSDMEIEDDLNQLYGTMAELRVSSQDGGYGLLIEAD